MPKIQLKKEHTLTREELDPKLETYLNRLRDDKMKAMNFNYTWKADRSGLELKGTGFTGDVTLKDQVVELVIDLSLMLSPFKGPVEESLKRGLDKYLV